MLRIWLLVIELLSCWIGIHFCDKFLACRSIVGRSFFWEALKFSVWIASWASGTSLFAELKAPVYRFGQERGLGLFSNAANLWYRASEALSCYGVSLYRFTMSRCQRHSLTIIIRPVFKTVSLFVMIIHVSVRNPHQVSAILLLDSRCNRNGQGAQSRHWLISLVWGIDPSYLLLVGPSWGSETSKIESWVSVSGRVLKALIDACLTAFKILREHSVCLK